MTLQSELEKIYPACNQFLSLETREKLLSLADPELDPGAFSKLLTLEMNSLPIPAYLPDLARLEWAIYEATNSEKIPPFEADEVTVNPTLQVLDLSWKNLALLVRGKSPEADPAPEPGNEFMLVWRSPENGELQFQTATNPDLLALKVVVENLEPSQVAEEENVPTGVVDRAIRRASDKGILIPLRSRIRRGDEGFNINGVEKRFLVSDVFTLQWHITQACDLHCKHCYDRSKRSMLKLEQGIAILDDFRKFCQDRNVSGQITFTGGNPLLYPHFLELYKEAADRDLAIAILGNPAPRPQIEELQAIEQPVFYQVSLEGLAEHNDMIRGAGHFERVMHFLDVLKALNVYSMVMLTLTKENVNQVLPLAELLRDKTDLFTFNRLSLVGEGANLLAVPEGDYPAFLDAYREAAKDNPAMALKDNLINILRYQAGEQLFGGCAGYGCGAAFNFMCVLADGEAHACRKFPSLIGNVFEQSISDIYDSEMARRYRAGSAACRDCRIRAVCGGCLAVTYGSGLDVFVDKDPYCFMDKTIASS